MKWDDENLIQTLKNGGVAVIPTDTIYGIVGRAESVSTVNYIYAARKRNPSKPCIILVGEIGELEKFSILLSTEEKNTLETLWSEKPTSIILDCRDESLEYLHRGTHTLAFRLPLSKNLRELLLQTGPLIAPSANLEGLPSAENILEAKKYFGDSVDMYIDGGTITSKPSRVVRLHKDGSVIILRE